MGWTRRLTELKTNLSILGWVEFLREGLCVCVGRETEEHSRPFPSAGPQPKFTRSKTELSKA